MNERPRQTRRAGASILGLLLAAGLLAAPSAAFAKSEKVDALQFEIPEPYFGGTPLDYFGPNLEKPNYKPRPPFMAPKGTKNVARGKHVTSSDPTPEFGRLSMIVDGDKSYMEQSLVGLSPGLQWVQIDLGSMHGLYALLLWHFHEGERVYFDVLIQIADDEDFSENVRTVFNNDHDNSSELGVGTDKEYVEDYKAKLIDLKGHHARYVRFYSRGNTTDELNHYVEAEIFGKPGSE